MRFEISSVSTSDEANPMYCHRNTLLSSIEGSIKASNPELTKKISLVTPEYNFYVMPELS